MCGGVFESCANVSGDDLTVRVAEVSDRRPDTKITRRLIRAKLFELFRIKVVRVRIERMEHPVDRRFYNVIVIDLFTGNMVSFNDSKSLRDISFDIFGLYYFAGRGLRGCRRPSVTLPGGWALSER